MILTPLAFVPALLFYLFPVLVGRPIVRFLYRHPLRYRFISYFITGALVIYGILLLINYTALKLIPALPFNTVLQALILTFLIFFVVANFFFKPTRVKVQHYILPTVLSVIAAFLFYLLWQIKSPYPFNWDVYEHQTLVNTILSGRYSVITSHITDTFGFNGYSTIFHTLIALSQTFLPSFLFDFWHAISLLHFAFIVMGSYLLAKEVTGRKTIAVLTAILSAGIFDSNISFTTLFFIPQTFTAFAFLYLFIQLIKEKKEHRLPPVQLVIAQCFFLFINHYVVGTVAVVVYAGTYLYFRHEEYIASRINKKLFVEVSLFIGFLGIIFSSAISLGFLNQGEATAFTTSLPDKFVIMKTLYGFLFLIFLPIGISTILKRKKEYELVSLYIMTSLLAIILMQLPYVMKFYVLARTFVHIGLAVGIYTVMKQIKNPVFRSFCYPFIVTTLIIIFITNATVWKTGLEYHDIVTHISSNELQAADFLKKNYANSDTLLISDPATQHLLEPLSLVNTQGGAYMNHETRVILDRVSQTQRTVDIQRELYQIQDMLIDTSRSKRLLVLSARYFIWQQAARGDKFSLNYNIWYPADLTFEDRKQINRFLADPTHFTFVYQNPSMVIFEVIK